MKAYRCFLLSAAAAAALACGTVTAVAAPDDVAPLATINAEQYTIEVTAAPVTVGADASFQVKVAAKGGFKFNQAFPTKLKLGAAPDGLQFPKPKLKKGDGTASADGKSFVFDVPVKATRAGQFPFDAVLKFSVCNDDKCVVQRKKLKSSITAR
ncbi:MAG: hypothetical protein JRI23_33290 [Deltaproteobacteria bacterium]|jgi:hypothetical protein|nr:hypothetical protein [Deltaproteobacteria bacterium]MBW2537153.1 hypothetical protein [Deltaproteobacteria bacterium]